MSAGRAKAARAATVESTAGRSQFNEMQCERLHAVWTLTVELSFVIAGPSLPFSSERSSASSPKLNWTVIAYY